LATHDLERFANDWISRKIADALNHAATPSPDSFWRNCTVRRASGWMGSQRPRQRGLGNTLAARKDILQSRLLASIKDELLTDNVVAEVTTASPINQEGHHCLFRLHRCRVLNRTPCPGVRLGRIWCASG